jgi:hypothetical protein
MKKISILQIIIYPIHKNNKKKWFTKHKQTQTKLREISKTAFGWRLVRSWFPRRFRSVLGDVGVSDRLARTTKGFHDPLGRRRVVDAIIRNDK